MNKRIQKYYNTGKELSEEDWKKLPDTRIAHLVKIRDAVKKSFDLVSRNVEELSSKGQFSFDNLNIRLGRTSGNALNSTLRIKMESLIEKSFF